MSLLTLKRNRARANLIFFFVMAVCLSSVFKNLSHLLKQSFSKLQVMTKSHSFLALGDCAVFSRTWLLCYAAFDARATFFRAWGSCCVSPHLALHCVSRAWRPCCVFRAWRSCYVFPRLALELCFLYVALC